MTTSRADSSWLPMRTFFFYCFGRISGSWGLSSSALYSYSAVSHSYLERSGYSWMKMEVSIRSGALKVRLITALM